MSSSLTSDILRDSRFGCNICLEPVLEPVVTLCGHLYCWPCLFRWLEPGITNEEFGTLWEGQHYYRPVDSSRRTCPVCKTPCSVSSVVPIYVRHDDSNLHKQVAGQQANKSSKTRNEESSPKSPDELMEDSECTGAQSTASPSEQQEQSTLRRRIRSVPARPAYSPSREVPSTPSRVPSPPPPAGSLSTGLALSLQRALFGHTGTAIPSLHHNRFQHNSPLVEDEHQEPATEFLSRVLLMLGSFVILCLLLF